jgi:uncharacterized membrane protein YsdA (DUF1294 family)
MSHVKIALVYLILINLLSAALFIYDKLAATNDRKRIPERNLHFLELLGGVFSNLTLMYIIRHKNKKVYYYMWTWLILTLWLFIVLISVKI